MTNEPSDPELQPPAEPPAFEPIENDLTGWQVLRNWLLMAAALGLVAAVVMLLRGIGDSAP